MNIVKNTSYTPISQGRTGLSVANTLNSELSYTYGCERYEFTQSDISVGNLSYNHAKNTKNVVAKLYDSSNIEQNISGLFSISDANNWNLKVDQTLTEQFTLVVEYRP